jgi:drug/metabolite transporter (DMT)-like permease
MRGRGHTSPHRQPNLSCTTVLQVWPVVTTSAPLSHSRAHALLHFTVLVWGFTAILGRLISISAVPLVLYRLVLVVGVMGIVIIWRRLSFRIATFDLMACLAVGILVAVHWLLFYGCIKYAGVPVAVLCLSTVTFLTAILEPLFFHRKASIAELGVGFGVMVGVAFLVRLETQTDFLGLAMGLGSAFFSAAFGTLNGKLARRLRGEVMTFWELLAATSVPLLFTLYQPSHWVSPLVLPMRDAVWLAILAVGCTVLPWLWSLRVLLTLTPYALALAVSLEPVYAMALAWLIFPDAEQLTWRFYMGGGVLISLVAFNTWKRQRTAAA